MKRLTTNKEASEMSILELAYNSCYAKDGKARYRDYELDIDARELARRLLKDYADGDDAFESDEDFDDWMVDYLQDSMDSIGGLIAIFYRNLWAMAELRERLKYYEDLEEYGMAELFPCKVGDEVYVLDYFSGTPDIQIGIIPSKVTDMEISASRGVCFLVRNDRGCGTYPPDRFGVDVFLTQEQAEQVIQEMRAER